VFAANRDTLFVRRSSTSAALNHRGKLVLDAVVVGWNQMVWGIGWIAGRFVMLATVVRVVNGQCYSAGESISLRLCTVGCCGWFNEE
jgi:hypothetical protein